MIVRHQRESASNRGFRQLARYIRGREAKPRATWFLSANLPGVTGPDDLGLACKLVDAVQAQNTRAGSKRTYHLVISLHPDDRRLARQELQQIVERLVDNLGFSEHQYIAVRHSDTDHEHIHVAINKIHPETFRFQSPACDHQKLFTRARALERELGLTPLRPRTRNREKIPERAIDCEAHQGIYSFARWAREELRPALRATELRSWNDVHAICGRYGVAIRPHGNGLVFEDAERGVRVKASLVAREFSKTRLYERLGAFQPASERQREVAQRAPHRYSPMPARASQSLWKEYEQTLQEARARRERDWARYRGTAAGERRRLKSKYRQQRHLLAALPVSGPDRKRLFRQLELRQTIETRALKQKHATQRWGIQKTPHPGTWRHFVASRAAERDARAIRFLRSWQRERDRSSEEREL
ncbi:MAG: relaxase/mobilization nuclease domain-containing protein [Deltaproteobacteria bacterium]|nr:relaxase/mobilization nuclease domain-containing protein [Deltaproteobacteria bacterium]